MNPDEKKKISADDRRITIKEPTEPSKPSLPVVTSAVMELIFNHLENLKKHLENQKHSSWLRQAHEAIQILEFPNSNHEEGETLEGHQKKYDQFAGEQEGFKIAIDYVDYSRKEFIAARGVSYERQG
jgi:hypothetical protein